MVGNSLALLGGGGLKKKEKKKGITELSSDKVKGVLSPIMHLHEQAIYLNWKPTALVISMNISCVCYNKECCDVTGGRLSFHRFPSSFSTEREDMSLDLSPCQAMMSQSPVSPLRGKT
jgi:hypothetical protein